ncbi:MAG: hypothetical protein ACRENA_15195 [Vulcanimicrobiaceae bacterium]
MKRMFLQLKGTAMWQRARENLQNRIVRWLIISSVVGAPLFAVAGAFFHHDPLLRSAINGLWIGITGAILTLFSRNSFFYKKGIRIDWRV